MNVRWSELKPKINQIEQKLKKQFIGISHRMTKLANVEIYRKRAETLIKSQFQ